MPPFIQSFGLIIFGVLPSLVWLLFYFREDCHPEPKSFLAKVFLMGVIVSPLAIIFQLSFLKLITGLPGLPEISESVLSSRPEFFLWAAFVEEFIKFYAVSLIVLKNPNFDEPVDAMIYMIAAGLGFAAIENILIVFQLIPDGAFTTLSTLVLRFIGATLLHALASGLLGYFLAISWFYQEHRKKLIVMGLILATVFHFAFNIMISSFDNPATSLLYTTSLLLVMAYFTTVLFGRLKHKRTLILSESTV